MEDSDLIKLHEERERCTLCQGNFYGREYLAYFTTCELPHVLHKRCFLSYLYKLKDKNNLECGSCRRKWLMEDIVVKKMPDVLPCRLDGGDSPLQDGRPPAPRCPLAPRDLEAGDDPPDGTLPNDDITFCTNCGIFLKPDWQSEIYSKLYPYGYLVHCVLCLLSSIRGFPTEAAGVEIDSDNRTDEDDSGGPEEEYDEDASEDNDVQEEVHAVEPNNSGTEEDDAELDSDPDDDERYNNVQEEEDQEVHAVEPNNGGTKDDAEQDSDVCSNHTEGEEDKPEP